MGYPHMMLKHENGQSDLSTTVWRWRQLLPTPDQSLTTFFDVFCHITIYGCGLIMWVFHITLFIQRYLVEKDDSTPMAIVQYPCDCIAVILVKYNDSISCHQTFTGHHCGRTT